MRLTGPTRDDAIKAARAAWTVLRRRPGTSLVAAAMLVFLAPLLIDLFYVIPWPVRKEMGRAAFFVLLAACGWRLLLVRPGDERPGPDDRPARRHAWIYVLVCAALAIPLFRRPGYIESGDWDAFLSKYEAVRRSIADFGEFPWWDPWTRGGFPLAANPWCGAVGVATPLVLAFGTPAGMRLATLVCMFLAAEGARRLARLWGIEQWSAVAAGFIYAFNGAMIVGAVANYALPMCYAVLPWMLYHTFRLDRRPRDGFWLGFWLAFNMLNGILYFSVYSALIGAVVWARVARARTGPARRALLAHSFIALGTWFALAGWRVATTGWVYHDFPRHYESIWDVSPANMLRYLLDRPPRGVLERLNATGSPFWEFTCYIGPVVLILALASAWRGWRWWHTLTLACGWLAMGAMHWYQPSYWLKHWPLFTTMHVVTRWRYEAILGIALASASLLSRWRRSERRATRRLAAGLMLAIASDYISYGFEALPAAFRLAPEESYFPGPPIRDVVQVADSMGYPAIARGYGVIHGFEALIGYSSDVPTARLWRGHPRYVGEAWTADGPVAPASWSPNRITFRVEPGQVVTINQNPGSWWLVNGRRAFPDWRCAETLREFTARADNRGRLELRIRPRGLELGYGLHLAGVVLALGGWAAARALGRRGPSPVATMRD